MDKVRVRAALMDDAQAIAQVHVASWRSTYTGILPDRLLASLSVDDREQMWMQVLSGENGATHVFVVESDEDGIVGFAAFGPELGGDKNHHAELSAIYLLEEYQRKGAGRALFQAGVSALLEEGYGSMLLWVLPQNVACGFYEVMGGVHTRTRTISIGGQSYEEIGYEWTDLHRACR
ncbi:MAG: GNAT family N-acetyltransferase [Halospina sp.]